ncbi:hypothetical protein [Burkholderia territorii]|uniref:hypothetical protein n=1 Tax=Burkholderia territorii TaxID=1503055 RepID=UPI000A55C325|nr:hypothetical protein [Burkholderia territorii]
MSFSVQAMLSKRKFYAPAASADDPAPGDTSAAVFRHGKFDGSPGFLVEIKCRLNDVDQVESFCRVQWLSEPMHCPTQSRGASGCGTAIIAGLLDRNHVDGGIRYFKRFPDSGFPGDCRQQEETVVKR